MKELNKLLENAGMQPLAEMNDGDAVEQLFAQWREELGSMLDRYANEINSIVDQYDMHQEFKKSLRHQLKNVAQDEFSAWTRNEIEYIKRLPKSVGGDMDDDEWMAATGNKRLPTVDDDDNITY